MHTFTLAFEDGALNEGVAARRIAEAIGTEHQEVLLKEQEVLDDLVPALDSIDQPTFDGLNSYYMSRAVRRAGFKVALVETGGDELFGGYRSFRELPILQRWSQRTRFLPKEPLAGAAHLVAAALQPATGFPPQTRWANLPHMVRQGADLLGLYQIAYALFLPEFQEQLLAQQDPELIVRAAGLAPQAVLQLWNAFQAGARGLYWSRVWALFVLVRWCQRYGVRC